MSSTIIEAKFQHLDQTIRRLNRPHGPRVSSSAQLRELVQTTRSASITGGDASLPAAQQQQQQQQQQRTTESGSGSRAAPVSARRLSSRSADYRHQRRSSDASPPGTAAAAVPRPRTSLGVSREEDDAPPLLEWKDPKAERAQRIVQETWEVDRPFPPAPSF